MAIKKIFYSLAIFLCWQFLTWSMEVEDLSAEHPRVLTEDLLNLTKNDLELKDTDQLELLLSDVKNNKNEAWDKFEGKFAPPNKPHGDWDDKTHWMYDRAQADARVARLEELKHEIKLILKSREGQERLLE